MDTPTFPVLVVAVLVPFVLQLLKKYTSLPCGMWTQRALAVVACGLAALALQALSGVTDWKHAGETAVQMFVGVEIAYQWLAKRVVKTDDACAPEAKQ